MNAIAGDDSASTDTPHTLKALGPAAGYAAFALATTLCLFPTVVTMAATWAASGSYHHGFLIAPLVCWLIWRMTPPKAHDLSSGRPHPEPPRQAASRRTALAAVAAASLLWLVGRAASANIVEQVAFVSLLIAGAVLSFGPAWAKARAFPLALLYFMVPAGTSLAPALQHLAAATVTGLLGFTGVETVRDGLLLTTATGRFEIAEGCAGLNFLIASALIAAVYGWLAMRTWRPRLIVIAAAAALAVAANILRIFLVIALTDWSGGRIEIAADHLLFGWALYGVLLAAFMLAARRFADGVGERAQAAPAAAFRWKPVALAALAVLAAAAVEKLTTQAFQSAVLAA